ncbi:DUF1524 domain-containing protein [Arthrobacter sp. B3I9]|uniref:GmrSD restriction endonuclease domain-containing protein n=1 Tax=Arthrobacter sp. B3I9 TaxID=3042270 RepID=UPI0027D835D9|nr:DUF1524 domain-containing protein [Arthrobacter sp. B3I9]
MNKNAPRRFFIILVAMLAAAAQLGLALPASAAASSLPATSTPRTESVRTEVQPATESTPEGSSPGVQVPVSPFRALDTRDTSGPVARRGYQPPFASRAVDLLETLSIKGRAPKTGYEREQFGQAWADVDRNGCDTRNDILQRDLVQITFTNSVPCQVAAGTLHDPYTAKTIAFVRGVETSSAVQIDHVVALSDAWQKGAQQLTAAQRTAFANDSLNLLAVDGPANMQKGDGDAATWLPPQRSYWCDYVARQIAVKATYNLWVTQAEHDSMADILGSCPDTSVPTNQPEPLPEPEPTPAPAPAPAPEPDPAPAPAPAPAPYYANCTAVRNAGAAPLYAGQPGYSFSLDRDRDGVACE